MFVQSIFRGKRVDVGTVIKIISDDSFFIDGSQTVDIFISFMAFSIYFDNTERLLSLLTIV